MTTWTYQRENDTIRNLGEQAGGVILDSTKAPFVWQFTSAQLGRFAELIERAAMEKAAKIAEMTYEGTQEENEDGGFTHLFGTSSAAAIRAACTEGSPMTQSQTPLTVEALLKALERSMTIAGYNGTCERVVSLDALKKELLALLPEPHP